jgi:murein L,D-transpeptidase YafK
LKAGRHLTLACCAAAFGLLATAPGVDAQLARELGLIAAPEESVPGFIAALPTESSFALEQLRHERVREARLAARHPIKRLFHERGIRYPAAEVFMRIFKRERTLELWALGADAEQFALLKTYTICALAGELGPKRRQGDNQTPEGFYAITFFNPRSDFYLSLHVDYPNRRDRALAKEGVRLGGDIYIHGGCSSEGCLAVTDEGIKELYWLAVEARAAGQQRIPVHVFPARLDSHEYDVLMRSFSDRPDLTDFWATLKPGYDFFEQHRRLPNITVDARGDYAVNGAALRNTPGRRPLGTPIGAPVDPPIAPGDTPAVDSARTPPPAPPVQPAVRRPLGTPVGG